MTNTLDHYPICGCSPCRLKRELYGEASSTEKAAAAKYWDSLCKAQPTQTSTKQVKLPTDPKARKALPIASGVLDYFPDALAAIAECSKKGNDQHNPGQPLHWDRSKSTDHADCIVRHLIDRGTMDSDGIRHSAKVAWRALALLQTELEAADKKSGGG